MARTSDEVVWYVEIPYNDPVAMRKFDQAYLGLQNEMADYYTKQEEKETLKAQKQYQIDERRKKWELQEELKRINEDVKAEQAYTLQMIENKRIQQKIIAKQQKAIDARNEEKMFVTYIKSEEMPNSLAEKRALLKKILAAKKRIAKKKAKKIAKKVKLQLNDMI